jgi:subtilisin family serine protease
MSRVSKRIASGTIVRRVPSRSSNRVATNFDRLEDRTVLANILAPIGTIADEIIVQYRPEANVQVRAANRHNAGFGLLDEIESAQRLNLGAGMIEVVKVPSGMTTDQAVAWISRQPGVESAEPNQILKTSAVSNDPYYTSGSQWDMYGSDSPTSIGPGGTTNQYGVHAENAWNANYTGSRSVFVGIIDTGVQITHPDLAANIWVNPYDPVDGIDNDGNGYIDDTNGWDFANNDRTVYDNSTSDAHGTHVAGTIGAVGGNGIGVAGLNWQVTMIVAKFISGNSGTTSAAIRAIDYITDLKLRHGLDIAATNNSWGGGSYSSAMNAAINRAAKADILFVTAAGNNSSNNDSTAYYPANYSSLTSVGAASAASYENVISVASITNAGDLSSFSNYGATRVDIAAPGSSIISTLPNNTYGIYNGTSMAAPHVTGTVALLKSIYASATAEEIRNAILSSATPTPALRGVVATGARLNVMAAINDQAWDPIKPKIPRVSVNGASRSEGNSGTSNLSFSIALSEAYDQPVTINYATQNGTALAGADYISTSGSIVIPAGATSAIVNVAIIGDTTYESNETFRFMIVSATNATIVEGEATGTIVNDDAIPILSVRNASLIEGNSSRSNMIFAVSMTNPADSPVTLQYYTSDQSARAGSDYVATSGTITIPAGSTSTTIPVPILGDSEYESDETFLLNLTNPSANARLSTAFATGTIINDDSIVVPAISIANASIVEGNAGTKNLVFNVTLDTATTLPVSVAYATSDITGIAGSDYVATSGNLVIAAGSTSAQISVPIIGDTIYEANESFLLKLVSATNATIAGGEATGTIVNDDQIPIITVRNASVIEGNSGRSSMIFTVSLTNAADTPVTLQYYTSDQSARAGSDYVSTTGTITIPAGSTSTTISIQVLADSEFESDETFLLNLTNPSANARISTAFATGTIINDDTIVVPTISIANASIVEGNAGTKKLVFNVTLDSATTVPVSVAYASSDLTAFAGTDYVATSGTLIIAAGSTSAQISVPIIGDTIFETDETFRLTLSSPSNATIATGIATGTIINDDSIVVPTVSIANASIVEGNAGTKDLVFHVTLDSATTVPVSVTYASSDLSAFTGTDYVATSGILIIAAGSTTSQISVPIIGDTTFETDETFRLTLSSPSNATIATGIATGTIVNDDTKPVVTVRSASQIEGDSGQSMMAFVVELSNASSTPVSIDYETSDITATAGLDYASTSGTLSIPAGATSAVIQVPISGDTDFETDESFLLNLISISTNATIGTASATGTIINDDVPPMPLELSISDSEMAEGNSGWSIMTFEINLSGPATEEFSFQYVTKDGTANSSGNTSDFEATAGIITIPAGHSSATISVRIRGERTYEIDETFSVVLSRVPDNIVLLRGEATGKILNDDTLSTSGPRGSNSAVSVVNSTLAKSAEIVAAPLPELDFVLGEWMSNTRKPGNKS